MKLFVGFCLVVGLVANVYAEAPKYDCAKLKKSEAEKYYKEGHLYLDSNNNKIPCDELAPKPTELKTKPQPAPVVVAPPAVTPPMPHVSANLKSKKKGKCRTVKGYRKKNGTYVKGYTRCK